MTSKEIPLGRVKEVLKQDLEVKLGSVSSQSGVIQVRLGRTGQTFQPPLAPCPPTHRHPSRGHGTAGRVAVSPIPSLSPGLRGLR